MCRGQGTAYMLAEFSGNDCPMDFRFVAKDERETQLPLETYELESKGWFCPRLFWIQRRS